MEKEIHPIIIKISHAISAMEISNFELAKLAGISRTTVGRIFSGESSPSLENLQKLADVANIELVTKNKFSK